MALSEKTVINQVTLLLELPAIHVQWANLILRDDDPVPISSTYHRKAYTQESILDFIQDVPSAQSYMDILGWSVPNE